MNCFTRITSIAKRNIMGIPFLNKGFISLKTNFI